MIEIAEFASSSLLATLLLVATLAAVVVAVLAKRSDRSLKTKSGAFLTEISDAFSRYDNGTGKIDVKKMGLLCLIDMKIRPSNIHLRDVAKQCWEKNNPGQDPEACKDDHFVEIGDFAMFIQEVRSVTQEIVASKKPKVRTTPIKPTKNRSLRRSSSSSFGLRYQVFLGGSCNPTTWRRDLAIPHLTNSGVTFYDPQVDDWSPRYVELEDQAKESSEVLFFVIDNQTRGIASMVELAYLAGAGRTLVAVMLDFDVESAINGEVLKERERTDLNRGHDFLCSILHREGIPLFEDISIALNFMTNMIRTGRSLTEMSQDGNATVPVFRGLCLTSGIFTANNTFKQYDALGNGSISMTAAQLALKSYFGRDFTAPEILKVLRIVDQQPTSSISRNHFLCMVADTLEAERQASSEVGLHSSFYAPKDDDLVD
jgi:Ca2+-binding EF-hand superfamily protein